MPHKGLDPRVLAAPCFHPLQSLAPPSHSHHPPCQGSWPPGIGIRVPCGFLHLPITWPSRREIRQQEIRQLESFCCLERLCGSLASAARLHGDGDTKGALRLGQRVSIHPRDTFTVSTTTKKGHLFSCCNSRCEAGTTRDISNNPVFLQAWSPEKHFAPGKVRVCFPVGPF